MKWFTGEWYDQRDAGIEGDAVVARYLKRLSKIRESLPVGLQMLAEAGGPIQLAVGHFIRIPDTGGAVESLAVDIAVQNHWDDPLLHVRLVYRDCVLLAPPKLRAAQREDLYNGSILCGEVDVLPNGTFEHRLLLAASAIGEFAVRFKDCAAVAVAFDGATAEVIEPNTP